MVGSNETVSRPIADQRSGETAVAPEGSPDYVEYPDGAPPELIREMKEADMTLGLPKKREDVTLFFHERDL